MPIFVRIRNGMRPDEDTGQGGATEGDIRGNSNDFVEQTGGVPFLLDGDLLVHEDTPNAMGVTVDPGIGYIPNSDYSRLDGDSIKFWEATVTTATDLVIGANSSGSTRIDLVCLKLDVSIEPNEFASNIATLVVVAGTPGAGVPTTPDDHLVLARVTVVNGETSITNAEISDQRSQITLRNTMLEPGTVALTDGATVALDSSQGNVFTLSASGNRTIAAPTKPTDGQKIIIIHHASGGARTLSLTANAGGFVFGTDITALSATESGKRDLIGAIYSLALNNWMVVAYIKGYEQDT